MKLFSNFCQPTWDFRPDSLVDIPFFSSQPHWTISIPRRPPSGSSVAWWSLWWACSTWASSSSLSPSRSSQPSPQQSLSRYWWPAGKPPWHKGTVLKLRLGWIKYVAKICWIWFSNFYNVSVSFLRIIVIKDFGVPTYFWYAVYIPQ